MSSRTKFARVHKTPEPIIGSFDPGTFAGTRYEDLHGPAQNVGDDLDKQLTDTDLISEMVRTNQADMGIH